MAHSNSSLNCFTECMAKYEHRYVLHTPPCKGPSLHLTFGTMAHDVLYKAGRLRDENCDGVADGYEQVIPSEILYPELKDFFGIANWHRYFVPVIKQVAEYEKDICSKIEEQFMIERELKVSMSVEQLHEFGYYKIEQPLVGVIDLLILTETGAIILDYKFSTKVKTQDNFDIDSQLQLYAWLVHVLYDKPLHNIQIGYIDIPKSAFDEPILLSNGTLSRSKAQNISQDMYKKAVEAVHGTNDPKYNCEPGGWYYDAYCEFALKKSAYLSMQYVDVDIMTNVTEDCLRTAQMIDIMRASAMPMLRQYSTYSCSDCEYFKACKPWLYVDGGWK